MGLLCGNWMGYQKIDGKLYPMTCTDIHNILYLSVNVFSPTCVLNKGFNVMSEKESIVLKKITNILKFEERLDHGNGGGDLIAARLYVSLNDA